MKFGNGSNVTGLGGGTVGKNLRMPMSMPENPTPPPPEPTDPSAAMITFAADWQALAEPTHAGMYQDPAHQREMLLMTDALASRADCTHVAVQDGDWTDATTWLVVATGLFGLPGAGHKLGIPAGVTVTMNNNTTTAYDTLRVDGSVVYPINQNTTLYIDTIVVNHGGVWQQGTEANPIPAAYTSETVHPDNGNIDTTLATGDFLLLGRGFLGMGATTMMPMNGSITMVGADKTKWATTDQTRSVGATTITVDALPADWAIDDEIYIAGTILGGYYRANQGYVIEDRNYDKVTITARDSGTNTITFTPALAHARAIPAGTAAGTKYHVVNLTRNIRYRSPDGTLVHRKGHMMVMGENIHIENVEWKNLGRTRKDFQQVGALGGGNDTPDPSFDATNDALRLQLQGGNLAWDADANVRGRYPLHVHRSGVSGDPSPAIFKGNAINTAPGWGVAVHQSNATVTDNVCVEYSGAGFMGEIGSEYGVWSGNFAGGGHVVFAGTQAQKLDNGVSGWPPQFGDFGLFGDAFWFRGRMPILDGNVAADCHFGFVWMARGGGTSGGNIAANQTPEPRIFYGHEQTEGVIGHDNPTIDFKNNTCYAASLGALVIKNQANQKHSFRSNFFNFKCWEIGSNGIDLEYTAGYSLKDLDFHFSSKRTSDTSARANGVLVGPTTNDAFIDGVTVRHVGGNARGVSLSKGGVLNPTEDNRNGLISDRITVGAGNELFRLGGTQFTSLGGPYPEGYEIFTDAEAADTTLLFVPSAEPVFPTPGITSGTVNRYVFDGLMTTELGAKSRSHEIATGPISNGARAEFDWVQLREMVTKYGYFTYTHPTHGASRYVLVPDLIAKHRLDANGDVQIRYLTLVLRINPSFSSFNINDYTDRGALATRYTDAITAATWVVYEDALGVGGIHEGL